MRGALLALLVVAVALLAADTSATSVVAVSEPDPIVGDADCNQSINLYDSLGVVSFLADVGQDPPCLQYADVNCDQAVDLKDVAEMLRHSAGVAPGNIPTTCSQIGWAVGLPSLAFEVDETIDVSPATIPGIGGGDPRPLAAVVNDDGFRSLFVENELVIVTDDLTMLNDFLNRWGGTLVRSIDPSDAGINNVPSIHLVRLDTTGVSADDLADDLRALSDVAWGQFDVSSQDGLGLMAVAAAEAAGGLPVDLNWVAEAATLDQRQISESAGGPSLWSPNPFDWAYMNRGSNQDMGVADAWRALQAAGKLDNKVKVAILDGGFSPNPDFPAGYEMNGPTGVPNPASCTAGSSCPWHGTVVTAAAMGVIDNGFGVAGPAGPVADAVLTQSPSLDIFEILEYVFISIPSTAITPPTVLNISAGFGIPSELCLTGICLAMDSLTSGVRALGVLFFAAAGNDKTDVDAERCIDLLVREVCYEKTTHIPCELAFVICVGGLDWDSTSRRSASNYGTDGSVDIFGPMVQFSTPTPDSGIKRDSCGTSCASPFVAGVAALIKAANPGLSAGDIEDIMMNTAHDNSTDSTVSRWVNAYAAVIQALGGNQPPELSIQFSSGTGPGGIPISLSALVTDPEDRPFLGDPYNGLPAVNWTSSLDGNIGTGPNPPDVTLSYGTHIITATATDSGGSVIADTRTLTLVNYAPEVDIISPLNGAAFAEGQSVQLRGGSVDLNRVSNKLNDPEVQWFRAPQNNPANRTLIGAGHLLTTSFVQGDYVLTFVGTDDQNVSDEESVSITVGPPPVDFPPLVTITAPPPPQPNQGPCPTFGVTFTGTASDPEDGNLTGGSLVWMQHYNGVNTPLGTGTSITVYSFPGVPANTGFTVSLTATDSNNGTGQDVIYMEWVCFA